MTNGKMNAMLRAAEGERGVPRAVGRKLPGWTVPLFLLFSVYLVLPLVDVPFMGLSLSAPVFFFIAMACLLRPPAPWLRRYQGWIILAGIIWIGIFFAAAANGLMSGGVEIDTQGVLTVVRYAYWLLVFVITVYLASQPTLMRRVSGLLGGAVLVLALGRWGEVAVYGNLGAWTGTHLMSQNSYGLLFSTFSPFLFAFFLQYRGVKRWIVGLGVIILLGAVAINGSRGSWVGIALGLALSLGLYFRGRARGFFTLLAGLLVAAAAGIAVFISSPAFAGAVSTRFSTLFDLGDEKSYMIRVLMNQKALRLFELSPLVGVGAARFTKSSVELTIPAVLAYAGQEHFDVKSSHNSYLGFLAENGLVGAVPYALLLGLLLWRGSQAAVRAVRRGEYFAAAAFLAFLQMSIHMWATSSLTDTAPWFVYGLTAALIAREHERTRRV